MESYSQAPNVVLTWETLTVLLLSIVAAWNEAATDSQRYRPTRSQTARQQRLVASRPGSKVTVARLESYTSFDRKTGAANPPCLRLRVNVFRASVGRCSFGSISKKDCLARVGTALSNISSNIVVPGARRQILLTSEILNRTYVSATRVSAYRRLQDYSQTPLQFCRIFIVSDRENLTLP